MSDAMVPSYRVQRDRPGVPWMMLAAAGGLLAVGGVAAGGWWAFQSMGGSGVPVVEADPRPFKVRPDDPGGLRVPNQNALVLERPGNRQAQAAPRADGLVPEAEAPNLALLRAAVAPPPVIAPRPVPTPQSDAVVATEAPEEEVTLASLPFPPPAAPEPPGAATTVAAAVPAPVAGGRALVQLAAVGSEEAARGEWDRLARRAPELFQGRSPVVQRVEREGGSPLFRLRASGFADSDSAAQFCEQARARSLACILVR
ncbi:SPOR domain-containing protein [Falsiroseomonas sp. E2-1-a20]|uniref:SPOR domain-containing protein n=1 Tax=Falsiroseomonas sp. E2-1-a20 TaxID=3239300 RepID=UPI003F381194